MLPNFITGVALGGAITATFAAFLQAKKVVGMFVRVLDWQTTGLHNPRA